MPPESWQTIAARKRASAQDKIPTDWRLPASYLDKVSEKSLDGVLSVPRDCGLLSLAELEITEQNDAVSLLQKLADRSLTAVQVSTAFSKRAAIAQQLTHCLTEMFFDQALARAQFLDDYLEKEGKVVGPLHGLPISIKDCYNVAGIESTLGYVSFIGKGLPTKNSPLVDILLGLGAVLYVKTNIPQTLMSGESVNNIFGRVLNPHRLALGGGGSSGGEGVLVAMRGSLLGVGTDIAGSIRIPSLCDGTYGFKPSSSRVPYGGQTPPGRIGSPGFLPSAGPLATSSRDLQLFAHAVLSAQPRNLDPTCLGIPWRETPKKRRLVLGIPPPDSQHPLHPPVARALETAAARLQAAGHEIKRLDNTPSISDATVLAFKYFYLDNTGVALQNIQRSGEPPIASLATSGPDFGGRVWTVDDVFELNVEREGFVAAWERVWLENGLDAIVMPGAASTAVPHDMYGSPPYTVVWNLVDCPACIVPYLKADATVDVASADVPKYDPEIVDGAPCAIQVVGRRLQDEELLSAVETISEVLHG